MSVSIELLDALKSSQGNVSDYRAAKILGVKQQTMTKYRQGHTPLSAEKVLFICKLAGLDAEKWLLRLYMERAKSDEEITVLQELQNRLAA